MKAQLVYQKLADKRWAGADLARRVLKEPRLVPVLIDGMGQAKAETKYGCANALRVVVDEQPEMIYRFFETFAGMLGHPNKIFQWEAIYLVSRLAGVDEESKIDGVLDAYFSDIEGPNMITAANIISGAGYIAVARRDLAARMVSEILRAERGRYETSECYEVVCGAALKAFAKIYKLVDDPQPMLDFARRHQGSSRVPTKSAAARLLAKQARSNNVRRKERATAG